MRRIFEYILLAFFLFELSFSLCAFAQTYDGKVEIADLLVTNTQEQVLVYFKLKNAFKPEIKEAILAGITTTIIFTIELYRERSLWSDKKISSLKIKHSLKYDNIKKVLYLSYSETDKDPEQFKELMKAEKAISDISGIPVAFLKNLVRDKHYYVRVKAQLDKVHLPLELKNTLLFSSLWHFETKWVRQDFVY